MFRLMRDFSARLSANGRGMLLALGNVRCTRACQVDRELMSLRTDLTGRSGWGAAGMQ
jgi:hypothetical protein